MQASVLSAEDCTIELALNLITISEHEKFIIFSDSLSVLISRRKRKKKENPLIIELRNKIHGMHKTKAIIFSWVTSNIGIKRRDRFG